MGDENTPEPRRGISYTEVISLALQSEPLSGQGATTSVTDFDDLNCPEAKIDLDDHYLRNVYNLHEEVDADPMEQNDALPMLPIRKISGSWQSASFRSNKGDAEPTSFGSTATDLDLTSTATDFAYENYRRGLTAVQEMGPTIAPVPECAGPRMSM